MLKHMPLLVFACAALLISAAAKAIPPAINIPEPLLEGKLLGTHRKQIDDRVAWWKKSLLAAKTDEDIQRAGEKLLNDYQLYPNPNYQQAFAEETLKQYTDVLNGKAFSPDDSLVPLKRINAALILTQMEQPNMQPALQILVADKNEALRFLGWQGYDAMRKNLLNGSKEDLAPLIASTKTAVEKENNPILLSAVYRVMNLGKLEGQVREPLRQAADAAFLQALQTSWPRRCKQVRIIKTTRKDLLPALRVAVRTLRSIGKDLQSAGRKDAEVTRCLQMTFDMAAAAAQTYDRAWQNRNTTLLEPCTDLLEACESAFNALAGVKNAFLKEKLNPRNEVPDRGAAVLEAVLVHWAEALKDKGVQDTAMEK
ncbi:MAG: hypothetical protein JW849_08880 [Phycisphaerae bacterium]|nr:hypothetical protein [Phycisphaerae bacterium]